MVDAMKAFGQQYEIMIRHYFRFHPNQDELLPKMIAGELTLDEVDLAFAEAEAHTAQWFIEHMPLATENEDGTVTFLVSRGDKTDTRDADV